MNSVLTKLGIKGLLFDYGGTLDTGGDHWGIVLWKAWQEAGVPVGEASFREAYVYAERTLGQQSIIRSDFSFSQTLEAKLQLELDYVGQQSFLKHVLDIVCSVAQRHTARSREVLRKLANELPLVLVSNFYGNLHVVLQEFGLESVFRQVIESAVVGIRKPDSKMFLMGADALGLAPEEVAVVGDSFDNDIIPAKKAGCRTIWMKGAQWTDKQVNEHMPDLVVSKIEELL